MAKTHSGWVTFAGVMLFLVGVLNVIYGIAAIGDSSFFVQDQKYILSKLNTWGWVTLIIGLLQQEEVKMVGRRRQERREQRGTFGPGG